MTRGEEYEKVVEAWQWMVRVPGRTKRQAITRTGLNPKLADQIWPSVAPVWCWPDTLGYQV
jgi:hypothetical protein